MTRFYPKSEELNKKLSKKIRKKEGIYFTPISIRDRIFELISPYISGKDSFLEPSCGSGEFIYDIQKIYKNSRVTGVEKNKFIYDSIKDDFSSNTMLINIDFLKYKGGKFNFIIGNPPFYVTKEKNVECMKGRGNIFVLITYKCIKDHLYDGGIIAFVLPTSFYNCSYYEKCREYLASNTTIINMETVKKAKFHDTKQDVMIFIARKEIPTNDDFLFKTRDRTYLSPNYKKLRKMSMGYKNIIELGFKVVTGTIVWNQHKEKLTTDDSKKLLIYSSNIKNGSLELSEMNGGKKQYIDINKEPFRCKSILVNRGYGNKYDFKSVLIDSLDEYFVENHLNVILPIKPKISVEKLKSILDSERIISFIKLFTGNGSLSKTEIENILPIMK